MTSASLEFSPNSRLLASAAHSGEGTQILDAREGRVLATLPNDGQVRSVAFSPDGTILATGQYDGAVRLWSTETWRPNGPRLEGHEGRVLQVDFSRDGVLLASAGTDGTVALWDVKTRREILTHDDQTVRRAAQDNPAGFVAALTTPVAFDEVQRVPELMTEIKLRVDRDQTPGPFAITGSANLLRSTSSSNTVTDRSRRSRSSPQRPSTGATSAD